MSSDSSLTEAYARDGFLVVENLLPGDHIAALRARMQAIADGEVDAYPRQDIEFEPDATSSRPNVRKINRCAENDQLFWGHAARPEILDIVERFIGPDIKLFGSQCFMKPPGGVEKPFHQDSAYFPIEPMALVTCWTALDDVTHSNGCLRVLPGSHRNGLLAHDIPWHVGDRIDKQVGANMLSGRQASEITFSAGSCSFHHSLLLHASGPNKTRHPRRGLAVHYMSAQSRWTADSPQPQYQLLRGVEHAGYV